MVAFYLDVDELAVNLDYTLYTSHTQLLNSMFEGENERLIRSQAYLLGVRYVIIMGKDLINATTEFSPADEDLIVGDHAAFISSIEPEVVNFPGITLEMPFIISYGLLTVNSDRKAAVIAHMKRDFSSVLVPKAESSIVRIPDPNLAYEIFDDSINQAGAGLTVGDLITNNIVIVRNASDVNSGTFVTQASKSRDVLSQLGQSSRKSTAPDYTTDDLPFYSCRGCKSNDDGNEELVSFHSIAVLGQESNRIVATTSFNLMTPVLANQGPVSMANPDKTLFPLSIDTDKVNGRRKMIVEAIATNDTAVTFLQEGSVNKNQPLNEYVWFCGPLQERLDNGTSCAGHPVASLGDSDWLKTSVLNHTLDTTSKLLRGSLLERLLFQDPSALIGRCSGGLDPESGQIVTLLPTNCLRDCLRFPEPDCEVPRAEILWFVIGTQKDGLFVSPEAVNHFQRQMVAILHANQPQLPLEAVVIDVVAQHANLQFHFFVTDIGGEVVPQLSIRAWITRSFATTFASGYGFDWTFMGFGTV